MSDYDPSALPSADTSSFLGPASAGDASPYTVVPPSTAEEPTWAKECRAKGGTPIIDPDGNPQCQLPNGVGGTTAVAPTVFNGFSVSADFSRFTTANLTPSTNIAANVQSATRAVVDGVAGGNTAANKVLGAIVPDVGDLLSKVTGLPKGIAVAIALLSVYALGVQAGIVPPLRRLVK